MKNNKLIIGFSTVLIVILLTLLGVFQFSTTEGFSEFTIQNDYEDKTLFVGSEQITGEGLEYRGSKQKLVRLGSFRENQDVFQTFKFRNKEYILFYGDSIETEFFEMIYLPVGKFDPGDEVDDGFVYEDEYYDRFRIIIKNDAIKLSIKEKLVNEKIGNEIVIDSVITNNLFNGITIGIDVKTSDLGLFRQSVTSFSKFMDLGNNDFSFSIPNEFFGKKRVDLTRTVMINDQSFAFSDDTVINFETDRSGNTNLIVDEEFNFVIDNPSNVILPIEDIEEDIESSNIFNYFAITTLIFIIILIIIYFRGKRRG